MLKSAAGPSELQAQIAAQLQNPQIAGPLSELQFGSVVFFVRDGRVYRSEIVHSVMLDQKPQA